MKFSILSILSFLLFNLIVPAQSVSFQTYMNPVIPGDHPDCTLTKVGNDFYTTGSSFNPTPVIYHSTDLVHWEAVAQPVSAAWSNYGDQPAGGCWGGQVVYYNNKWWDFFSHSNQMYFVTADSVRGPWSTPTLMRTPSQVPGLGYDNSIFIDDNGSWYLLVKNGQVNNWIVQLGNDGQPQGKILNLTWLNPSPSYPYSWAEGPVMWKHDGYYYYSFAKNVAGGQYVMRSKTLTDSASAWSTPVAFFNLNDPQISTAVFNNPNHNSAAVTIGNGTSWVVHPLWRNGNNNEWYGQGRQGLLNEVHYDTNDMPTADYPVNVAKTAPDLPSSGIPWMVPHTDFFNTAKLNPEWSFLGYTPANSYSLTQRPGWLWLSPKGKPNTIIKNDGEHNYSLITRVDFDPQIIDDEAGLQVFNGLQTLYVKLYSTVDSAGDKAIVFSFNNEKYLSLNTAGDTVWLKLVRVDHEMTGYWSADGFNWSQVGSSIDVSSMDGLQPNYNSWTGNRQGLFVQNSPAYFDLYIYRDAFTPIMAECPANQLGNTTYSIPRTDTTVLSNINFNNWAMYAGVEFGNDEYQKNADSIKVIASSATDGGTVEVYIDSIDASTKIADCNISGTGSWTTFKTFSAKLTSRISGHHDVYLLFTGSVLNKLFMLHSFYFTGTKSVTGIKGNNSQGNLLPDKFNLDQNYPNPFNPSTMIEFALPNDSKVKLTVYNQLGQQIATIADGEYSAGIHRLNFNGADLASGVYYYRIAINSRSGFISSGGSNTGSYTETKKMILMK